VLGSRYLKKEKKRLSVCLALFLGTTIIAACSYQYEAIVPAARVLYNNDITSVAVLPFLNLSGKNGEVSETSTIFASELARFREVKIVHPAAITEELARRNIVLNQNNVMEVGREIGRLFNVQSVIIGSVTEFDSYYPPVVGINIVLVDVHTGAVVDSRSEVSDASFNYVRAALKAYASSRNLEDSLYEEEAILHKCDLYIRFVCHEIIRKYL
jgi:TolB-like protein